MKNKIYHFISHTHWDREWYKTFEEFRYLLVNLVDDLLEIFKTVPDYQYFHLDGQTIILEDYLEIRPEKREELRQRIQEGKILIGPMYVLPDEFLVSGEALVRNFLIGQKVAEPFGEVMKVGYIPDSFGHIEQLPAILRGFDLDNVVLWRGFGGEPGQEVSEYLWQAPDGSEVLMIHLPPNGYGDAYLATENDEAILAKGRELQRILDPRAQTPHRLCMNGGDHHWPFAGLPRVLKRMTEALDGEFIHSTLEKYMQAVKDSVERQRLELPLVRGEHRFGYRYAYVVQGVYSTRMYLKQLNAQTQSLLVRHAEPLSVIAKLAGLRSRKAFLDHAWKLLLQNHPHDSICGTSVDPVHEEMVIRFKKSQQIAQSVVAECIDHLWPQPWSDTAPQARDYVMAWNPSPWRRTGVAEVQLDFPLQKLVVGLNPEVKVEPELRTVVGFNIEDEKGHAIPFQILGDGEDYGIEYRKLGYPKQTRVHRFKLLVDFTDVPALGWKGYRVTPAPSFPRFPTQVKVGERFLENDFLRIEVNERGEVRVTDKKNGAKVYGPLHFFADSGDVGDEYNYSWPERDEVILSSNFVPTISLVEEGPLRGALRIVHEMPVPKAASSDLTGRSTERVPLRIASTIYLDCYARRVDFITTVENTVKDHRLRVLFETGVQTHETFAETPFGITRRVHREYDPKDFTIEVPSKTHPMQRLVTIADSGRGFTLVSQGLPEYELKLDGKGTLALTLLRGVGELSRGNLITRPGGEAGWKNTTPGAQCLGTHSFRYSIFPHDPGALQNFGEINRQVEDALLPLMACHRRMAGDVPFERAGFALEPDTLCMTALKEAEDGEAVILRFFNPTAVEMNAVITAPVPVKEAFRTKLNERTMQRLVVEGGNRIPLLAKPWEIVTVRMVGG